MSRRAVALIAPLLGVGCVLVLHAVQHATDAARWPLSDYALGPGGWLLALAFVLFAAGELALASCVRTRLGSRAGAALLVLGAIGFLAVAFFRVPAPGTAPPLARIQGGAHGLSAQLAFLSLTAAMLVIAGRLHRVGMSPRATRALAVASLVLAWVGARQPPAVLGAWERVYLALLFGWLLRIGVAVARDAAGGAPTIPPWRRSPGATSRARAARARS